MKRTRRKAQPLATQMRKRGKKQIKKKKQEYDGNVETMVSTGSTILDLAISGGRKRGGGLPGGILVEIFGPSGSGKTVLLSEIGGAVQRAGGDIMFNDPEARLNKQFAEIFDLDVDKISYDTPNTVTEVFSRIREWEPKKSGINGVMADSLAALSTNMEMEKKEGDKMGMRRAKEFSEELRKTCRILADRNILLVCSNQVRVNQDAGPYGQKYVSPGGEAVGFYSSTRLMTSKGEKVYIKKRVAGKEVKSVIGICTTVKVFKNSVWKPYREAEVSIIFDYGIDDIRDNLKYVKKYTGAKQYVVNDTKLKVGIEDSIEMVEELGLEKELKEQVIDLWEEIESKFQKERKKKKR